MTRVNELLRREIAASLYRVVNPDDLDLAAVTITHVITSPDLRKARVLVSVRGDHPTRSISALSNHRKQIQAEISANVVLKYTPHLTFALDGSLSEGDRVLDLIDQLPPLLDADEPAADDDATFPAP